MSTLLHELTDPFTGGGSAPAGPVVCPCAAATRPIDCPVVQRTMREAWADSQSDDPDHRHEEGGFIVRNADGTYGAERWPRGAGATIVPPDRDADGSYHGREVVGEFHTHPNPAVDEQGRHWHQGTDEADQTGISREHYTDDSYIVSEDSVWRVSPTGSTRRSSRTHEEVPLGSRTTLIGQ